MKVSQLLREAGPVQIHVPASDNPVHKAMMLALTSGLHADLKKMLGPDTRKGAKAVTDATGDYFEGIAAKLKKIGTGVKASYGQRDSDIYKVWLFNLLHVSRSLNTAMENLGILAQADAALAGTEASASFLRSAEEDPFEKGRQDGLKQGKKDAASGKNLWEELEEWKKKHPTHDNDYNLGFSAGYELVAKDTHGTRGEIPVGHFGWVSKSSSGKYTFRPNPKVLKTHSTAYTGPSAKEKLRYFLRNDANIPTKDIETALSKLK